MLSEIVPREVLVKLLSPIKKKLWIMTSIECWDINLDILQEVTIRVSLITSLVWYHLITFSFMFMAILEVSFNST